MYASAILGKVRIHLLISILAASLHFYLITSYTHRFDEKISVRIMGSQTPEEQRRGPDGCSRLALTPDLIH